MSRKRTIAFAGIILLAGIALIENATRSDDILPATVTAVTSTVPDAGPDLWHTAFALQDGTEGRLGPLNVRPTVAAGDTLCIRVMKRSWAATKYQNASQTTC